MSMSARALGKLQGGAMECQVSPCPAVPAALHPTRESPSPGRCPVGKLVMLPAAAKPHSLGLLRERSSTLLTERCCCTWEKEKSWVVLHHSVPQNKHKTHTGKKGRDPWRCQVQEATVTSQSPVPQHGSSAPGECSEHPRPGVTTSRMIWFESLARNKCCALFTTWPSCYLSNGIAPGSSNSGDKTQHLSFPEIQLRAFLRL